MLSPLATCNLKQYWKHTKPQLVDTGFVLWELKQLQGLADGLRYIYNLGGSHFDLKGENILAFDEVGCNWPTLKIADFGSAKIQPRRSDPRDNSAPTNSYSQGTSAYEAPDYIILGHISRPCDVWTLGCIFMDMLVWTFGLLLPDQPDIETFSNERRQIKGGRVVDDTMFWYVAHDGKSKYFTYWKPALRERLQALKEVCDSDKGRAVFKELVVTTSKMLRMDPIARPKPYEIHNDMERITLWAEEPVKEEDANVQDRLIGTVPPTSKSEYAGKSVDDGMPVEAPRAVLMGSSIVFPDAYLARTPRPTRRLLPDGTDLHFMGSNEALHKESESTTFQLAVDGVDHLSGSQTPGPGIKAHRPLIGSHWMSPDRDTFAEAQTVVPSVAFSDDYPAPPSQWSNPGKRRGDRLEVPGNPKRRCSIS